METVKSASFECKTDGSNKEYHLQMVKSGSEFNITFQYGAIGTSLKPGTKTPDGSLPEDKANKLWNKLIKERFSKRYVQVDEKKN